MSDYTFDLSQITIAEYRKLAESSIFDPATDAILAKCAGVTVEEIAELSQPAYRRMLREFFKAASEPLADPN